MQQHNMSWIEVQFLKKAVDILCECRRTLMYTYVFAYYLRKNNQSEIFEVGFQIVIDLIMSNNLDYSTYIIYKKTKSISGKSKRLGDSHRDSIGVLGKRYFS